MPPLPQSEGSVIPLLEFDEADEEGASMDAYSNHGVYQAMGRNESVGGDVGETRAGQRQGENRSAQVSSSSLAYIGFEIAAQIDPATKTGSHVLASNCSLVADCFDCGYQRNPSDVNAIPCLVVRPAHVSLLSRK